MKGILKVLVLVVVVIVMSGCGGHYAMDKYIDQNQIVSSNSPDAIKVYVGEYRFNDRIGSPFCLNCSGAEGEISPWIKKALAEEIGKVIFVDSRQQADIAIETKKVEFNGGWTSQKGRVTTEVNDQLIIIKTWSRSGGDIIMRAPYFAGTINTFSKLLAQAINKSISQAKGRWVISSKLPKEIEAFFRLDDNNQPLISDISIVKAEE